MLWQANMQWEAEGHRIYCRCGDALGLVLQEILEPRDQWKLTLGYRSLEEPNAKEILVTNVKLVRRGKMLLIGRIINMKSM